MKIGKIALIFAVLPLLMKYLATLLVSATLLVPFGCERSNLFAPQAQEPVISPIHGPSDEILIALEVASDQPSVARALNIAANGFVRYADARYFAGEATSALAPDELGNYVALFLEKDFLHLADRYESHNDLVQTRYRIVFQHGGVKKSIQTDSVSAPASVQHLLARFAQHMSDIRKNLLTLALSASRDTLTHGEHVQLTLKVTNPHAYAVPLLRGERFVEFFVVAPEQRGNSLESRASQIWGQSTNAGIVQANRVFSFAPQQQMQINTSWNGSNNHGALLDGTYWLAARLATLPGGVTAMRAIHVRKQ